MVMVKIIWVDGDRQLSNVALLVEQLNAHSEGLGSIPDLDLS